MNPEAILETYVADVVRRLPRGKRADVAFELRSLLAEELAGRAADAGRPADAAMATDLLKSFGAPVDVADRYRPAGFTIIRPSDAPTFARVALIGVGVQWVITLIAVFTAPMVPGAPGSDWLSRLGSWWLSWGLGAFWWPGFIVTITMIAALVASRREAAGVVREPRVGVVDRDRIKRPVMAIYLALGVLGAAVVIALPNLASLAPGLPKPLLDALALDGEFVIVRAPWVLVVWAAAFAGGIAALVIGRWTRATRIASIALDVAIAALLLWWVIAGPVFTATAADSFTKPLLVVFAALALLDAALTVRRIGRPIPVPAT
ncbi:MAG: hypothetical protein M3Y31_03060 [Gemmatimonadota bacterium]|nr:hypothetical protein [Gemmatimonadota bacterium]